MYHIKFIVPNYLIISLVYKHLIVLVDYSRSHCVSKPFDCNIIVVFI